MFEVGAVAAVFRDGGPFVRQHFCAGLADIDHWLDGQHHALTQTRSLTARAEIRHLRIFVQARADSMSHKLADHAEAIGLNVFLNSRPNVAYRLPYCVLPY